MPGLALFAALVATREKSPRLPSRRDVPELFVLLRAFWVNGRARFRVFGETPCQQLHMMLKPGLADF